MVSSSERVCLQTRGRCLGDKTKERGGGKRVHVSTSVENSRMKRIEVELMGKDRVAGASAPLLLWAVH